MFILQKESSMVYTTYIDFKVKQIMTKLYNTDIKVHYPGTLTLHILNVIMELISDLVCLICIFKFTVQSHTDKYKIVTFILCPIQTGLVLNGKLWYFTGISLGFYSCLNSSFQCMCMCQEKIMPCFTFKKMTSGNNPR